MERGEEELHLPNALLETSISNVSEDINMDMYEQLPMDFDYNSDDYFEDNEFDAEPSTSHGQLNYGDNRDKKEKQKAGYKIATKLNPQLKGLMGEANLRFARGDTDIAEKMCFEVIRQLPNAWEPYMTLAQIYETTAPSKFKGYLTIASYLNPSNSGTWCRLAEICIEEGNKREALGLYSKCISHDKKNIEVHYKRLNLAKEIGEQGLVLKFQESLIAKLPEDRHEEIVELAAAVTKIYHQEKKYLKALNVLQIPFSKIPNHITPDLVNMMLELLLLTNNFSQCLDIFVDFCNFNFEIVIQPDERIHINDYSIPKDISVDLKTKFIVCAIKLKCFEVATKLIDGLVIEEDVEIVGDLFLDICEALMAENQYELALKLFVPLKKSKNFSLAGVWLKFSECLMACGLKEQAIEGYFTVITLAPQHMEVLHPLAKLLLEMNKKEEALEVMSYRTTDRLNIGVLIMRLKLLKEIGDLEEYWNCIEFLLSRHCAVFKNVSEVKVILSVLKPADRIIKIQKLREYKNDYSDVIPNQNATCVMEPETEKEYELLKEVLQFAMETREYEQMQKLALMACTSRRFEKYLDEITLYAVLACLYNGDLHHGSFLARDMVVKHPTNNFMWNLFNLFIVFGDTRLIKFIFRFHMRMPNIEACEILEGNSDLQMASYNSAMRYFIKEFKDTKSPYLSFILGIITLHIATISKLPSEDTKKELSETSTYLFLYYSKYRSKMASQEVYFNLGRMYQHLGIMYLSEHYYKKVFEVENELLSEHPDILCLKREAAYNLHLIYRNSGNLSAARNLLLDYVVI